jgi:hypothetical protein
MFEKTSRYYSIDDASIDVRDSDGVVRAVAYKRRRFVPRAETLTAIAQHLFSDGERLDVITARYLGDPTQFWRLCDANEAMHPEELTDDPGASIAIPFPR